MSEQLQTYQLPTACDESIKHTHTKSRHLHMITRCPAHTATPCWAARGQHISAATTGACSCSAAIHHSCRTAGRHEQPAERRAECGPFLYAAAREQWAEHVGDEKGHKGFDTDFCDAHLLGINGMHTTRPFLASNLSFAFVAASFQL